MGLDMYLTARRRYFNTPSSDPSPVIADVPEGYEVSAVECEVAYWRKANAIHGWLVEHVQSGKDDCKEHYVDPLAMQNLLRCCKEVLANHQLADHLLPVKRGPFFGGLEYDEYYFEQLETTVAMLEKAMAAFDDHWSFYYQASW